MCAFTFVTSCETVESVETVVILDCFRPLLTDFYMNVNDEASQLANLSHKWIWDGRLYDPFFFKVMLSLVDLLELTVTSVSL